MENNFGYQRIIRKCVPDELSEDKKIERALKSK